MSKKEKKIKEKKIKETLTPEQKKAKTKKGLKVTALVMTIVVSSLGVLVGIFAIVNVVGTEALMDMARSFTAVEYAEGERTEATFEDGYWTFTTDEDLKIMQLTDIHLGAGFMSQKKDSWAMNAVAAMIQEEKPDLVIATGDIVYPVPFQAGTFNNLKSSKLFATLMDSLGVYWTLSFGNHDNESYSTYDRLDLCELYTDEKYENSLFTRGDPNISGFGNQIIKVKNTEGIVTQAITMIDSHSYLESDPLGIMWHYDNIKQDQVDWFADEMQKINVDNKLINSDTADVKALAFFHIPLMEYLDAYKEYLANGKVDTANVQVVHGIIGEDKQLMYPGIGSDNFFEVGSENGLQGVFVGHDHLNNISIDYKKMITVDGSEKMSNVVRLTYGMSIDYLAYPGIYKDGIQRGCTMITVNPDGEFTVKNENYYQEKYESQYPKEDVTDQDNIDKELK